MIEGTSYLSAFSACELLTRVKGWKNIYANKYTLIYVYRDYILKISREESIEAMEREFRVGLVLNESHHTAIIRTYAFGYGVADQYTKCNPFIILERVHGKTLSHTLTYNLLTSEQQITVIRHIIYSLIELQEVEEFTHYDLHSANIILEEISPTVFHFVNGDRVVDSITTTLLPRFIDYASVYTKRMKTTGKTYMSATDIRRAPGIFDAFIDIQFVCTAFKMYLHYDFGDNWAFYPAIDIQSMVDKIPDFIKRKVNVVSPEVSNYSVLDLIICYEEVMKNVDSDSTHEKALEQQFYEGLGPAINRSWMEYRNRDKDTIMNGIVPFFEWLKIVF